MALKAISGRDPLRVKAAKDKWRKNHPEQMAECRRKWAEENREKRLTYCREYTKKYRADGKVKTADKEYMKKYYKKNSVSIRRQSLKRAYGITIEDYEIMFRSQYGVCKICASPPQTGKNLFVDHCHDTGVVKGLLCTRCNSSLGHARDSISILLRMVDYLGENQ